MSLAFFIFTAPCTPDVAPTAAAAAAPIPNIKGNGMIHSSLSLFQSLAGFVVELIICFSAHDSLEEDFIAFIHPAQQGPVFVDAAQIAGQVFAHSISP